LIVAFGRPKMIIFPFFVVELFKKE
jgi:hypothetical protein